MRKLTEAELEKYANHKGAKYNAVSNFLRTATNNESFTIAILNLELDTRLYKWNAPTQRAIQAGLVTIFK